MSSIIEYNSLLSIGLILQEYIQDLLIPLARDVVSSTDFDSQNKKNQEILSDSDSNSDSDSYQGRLKARNFQFSYSTEKWIEAIKEHTFKTKILPINLQTIEALINAHKDLKKTGEISEEQKKTLEILKNQLSKEIKEIGGEAFIKLETRSPKDSVYEQPNSKAENFLFEKLLQVHQKKKLKINWKNKIFANDILKYFIHSTSQVLKVKNGQEALDLLINSSRIFTDLLRGSEFKNQDGSPYSSSIIIRKWEKIKSCYEFRGFVHNNKLNCISQYFDIVFYPVLLAQKSQIEKIIRDFHSSIIDPKLKHIYKDYVIDFALLKSKNQNGKITLNPICIEINPFHTLAGPCLFSWKDDRDVIMGQKPFEFRIREECLNDPLDNIMGFWNRKIKNEIFPAIISQDRQKWFRRIFLLIILFLVLFWTFYIRYKLLQNPQIRRK
ncbi:cell division cycle protein [Anaeramoeba ignava]|uniref:Cell division cycle protein n=1 Tax=Anaeramoeba ignava TaxID=1746090 RepID=A0A9Q0R5F7_ANAIG|nr:cell division cycle protein [Anaeramoeba ignava]